LVLVPIGLEETLEGDMDRLYWKEIFYEPDLTTPEIVTRMDYVIGGGTSICAYRKDGF
jgi:hypothetical protein